MLITGYFTNMFDFDATLKLDSYAVYSSLPYYN